MYIVAVCGIMEEETVPPSASTERPGVTLLKSWLNKNMKVLMSDGRVLVGIFLCTDRWAAAALHSVSCDHVTVARSGNLIIGSCNEYTGDPDLDTEPRLLGLAMVPGHHIAKLWVDADSNTARPNSPALEDELDIMDK